MLLPINGKKGEEAIQVLRWNNLKDIMSVENARCRIIYCATICGEKERGGDENHSRVKEKERGRGGAGGESATVFTTLPAWAQPLSGKTHRKLATLAASPQRSWVSGNRKDLALCILVYL